jgi:3-methyladenine DNA glycosylase AlkD
MSSFASARSSGVARAIVNDVRKFCVSHADPDRARRYARYFTEGYDAWGVDHRIPEWEQHRKAWSDRLRLAGPGALIETGRLLTATGKYEEASFAILCAQDLREFYTPELFAALGEWFEGEGIGNWAHTDVFCKFVLSEFLLRDIVRLQALEGWRGSPYKYKRRAVPVTMVESLRKLDMAAWLAFVEPLMSDGEKVVHQGVGWFLREAWKKQKQPVEMFLLRHKDTAPRLIYQYATEKMDAAGKQRLRRAR